MPDPVEARSLSDRGGTAWEFVGDPSLALAQLRLTVARLQAENERLGKERTIYFMALEEIRERTRQNRGDSGAVAKAFHTARRALEQGFALRVEATRETALQPERDRLRDERDRLRDERDRAVETRENANAATLRAEHERDRLRAERDEARFDASTARTELDVAVAAATMDLRAENEALTKRVAVLDRMVTVSEEHTQHWEGEAERLREALLRIATMNMPYRDFTKLARHLAQTAVASDEEGRSDG